MCGACGVKPDWAGPIVAGPLRRRDIARCLGELAHAVTVHAISRGWLVKGRTGVTKTAQTLDELIAALAPHTRLTSWDRLEEALFKVSAPGRIDDVAIAWPSSTPLPTEATTVLAKVTHLPVHMKLAVFALGAHTYHSPTPAIADLDDTHQIGAHNGRVLGLTRSPARL